MPPMTLAMTAQPDKEAIRAFARGQGFDVVRFAAAETAPQTQAWLKDFLDQGLHGDMGWMAANAG